MANYKINWLERKTSKAGKPYTTLTLVKEDGSQVDATIFSSFLNYANLKAGDTVEGDLKGSDYNGKVSYVLEVPNVQPRGSQGFARGNNTRSADIEKAQQRKSDSIAYFNAVNSSIALVSKFTDGLNNSSLKEALREWRDWFLSEYEKYNEPTNKNPF